MNPRASDRRSSCPDSRQVSACSYAGTSGTGIKTVRSTDQEPGGPVKGSGGAVRSTRPRNRHDHSWTAPPSGNSRESSPGRRTRAEGMMVIRSEATRTPTRATRSSGQRNVVCWVRLLELRWFCIATAVLVICGAGLVAPASSLAKPRASMEVLKHVCVVRLVFVACRGLVANAGLRTHRRWPTNRRPKNFDEELAVADFGRGRYDDLALCRPSALGRDAQSRFPMRRELPVRRVDGRRRPLIGSAAGVSSRKGWRQCWLR